MFKTQIQSNYSNSNSQNLQKKLFKKFYVVFSLFLRRGKSTLASFHFLGIIVDLLARGC